MLPLHEDDAALLTIYERSFVPGVKHMGEPQSFFIILVWLYKLFGIKADPKVQLGTLPFKSKYP